MAASNEVTSSSIKRPRSKSTSPPPVPTYSLIFIDESERRSSSQIRRDIRSHVRKGSHERQRRLNAAAKARPLDGPRKLAQKGNEEKKKAEGLSRGKLLPKLQKLKISGLENEDGDVAMSRGGAEDEESSSLDSAEMMQQVLWDFPMDYESVTGFGSSADIGFNNYANRDLESSPSLDALPSSEENSPVTPVPLDRWAFKTTTPYALLLGKDGPVLQMQSNNWPFPRLSNKRPGVCVWMPCSVIPLPKVGPRPSLLRSSKIVPWICNSAEYFSFKEETIRWVNKRLDEEPMHEKTIGGIACLMSWEVSDLLFLWV
ncbi:hypothetical protein BKA64DRAFT_333455 [Cadophora sp. MPI-SDFR-AT-0126]|nr:hypothetical protein BKA64DRAFT_333455 [Leotiomycetes sp. MPI-SDFR-AT-0126]